MKSNSVSWLILLGIDGKMRLLTSETMELSCLSTGAVSAGVPWAAGPSLLAESSRVESCGCAKSSPAESCGSAESLPAGFCGLAESTSAGSWCCAESGTVAESYTISGLSTSDPRPPAESSTSAESARPVTPAESAKAAESAGPVTLAELSVWADLGGEGITVMVLFSVFCGTAGDNCTSCLDTYEDPDLTLSTLSRLSCCRDSDLDLRSGDDLAWWRRWRVAELEGRTSVTLSEARPDPGTSVGSVCLALELDPPDDVGRDRSPLLRHLDEWLDLGESWRLSDPLPHLPLSPLRDLWCSEPLVPEGTGPPSDLELPTTDTLDDRDFFLSRDLEGWLADIASVALDELADSALFFDLDDPSSLRLAGETWIPFSGAWSSMESSISCVFFAALAAAAALRLRFCWAAFSNASHASGNQSLHTSQREVCVQSVNPSFRRHCWQWWCVSLRLR